MVCKRAAPTAEMMDSSDTTMVVKLVVSTVAQMERAKVEWKVESKVV